MGMYCRNCVFERKSCCFAVPCSIVVRDPDKVAPCIWSVHIGDCQQGTRCALNNTAIKEPLKCEWLAAGSLNLKLDGFSGKHPSRNRMRTYNRARFLDLNDRFITPNSSIIVLD